MRLIDADKAEELLSGLDMQDLYLPAHFKELILDECPTVDAEPVVRCKECKLYKYGYCTLTDDTEDERDSEDFCSYGERPRKGLVM